MVVKLGSVPLDKEESVLMYRLWGGAESPHSWPVRSYKAEQITLWKHPLGTPREMSQLQLTFIEHST